MKLSIQFISLAVVLSGSLVSAAVAHKHHGLDHHHHKRYMKVHTETRTLTKTVVVNEHGVPYAQPTPHSEDNKIEAYVVTSTTSSSTATISSTTTEAATSTESTTAYETPVVIPESSPSVPEPNGDPECEFPDGEVDCGTFPDAYGAIPISWMKFGGWTGVQINGGAGDKCVDGGLCSYACPPGYSKAQWPEVQPASGESHGGLRCENGKLYKTNSAYNSLCVKGHGDVYVKNEVSKSVPICRTDYPGSENMNVPTFSTPGSKLPLTNPDGSTYYKWQGKITSAQYYVNPQGTSLEDGCVWGTPNGGLGNWSPMIFGVGYSNGMSWLSISQNQLYSKPLNFNVKIVGGPGAKLNGNCKYENGQFSGGGYGEQGCTAALSSGDAYFVLY
ncbi:hypothetical protein EV426DRAFT_713936 [Tirmania nivea]|nr:hypothetical protein EV426DRAFT_713936 [Tirmania nivea]